MPSAAVSRVISAKVPAETSAYLEQRAREGERTISSQVRIALREWIARDRRRRS